ncbi:hypothetical protein LUZ61_002032 [Rhynchospora tenuis]|uniref:Rhodanese domain-containing protein n=1 Tax=Rhynchospora tenuis TaxID=198213 RepID=A0AAD5ZI48_9POAL|nr:hypothetical protein LUZ61_002032 [Rhynchospora tenuis]
MSRSVFKKLHGVEIAGVYWNICTRGATLFVSAISRSPVSVLWRNYSGANFVFSVLTLSAYPDFNRDMAVLGLGGVLSPPRVSKVTGSISTRRKYISIRAEVIFVNGDEAKKLVNEEGYKILDVRDKTQFERAHINTCYHVPLFIENEDSDLGTIIKRTVHNNFAGLFFGLPFTKQNPDFVKSIKEQLPTDSKLLVVCQEGLRSTAAANRLEREGYQNLACIISGLQSLQPGTFDSVGKSELQNAGKAGLVTVQGKISAVLGTVLICAYLFITFFPDQAEKILQLFPSS